jgi:hypothetical protein
MVLSAVTNIRLQIKAVATKTELIGLIFQYCRSIFLKQTGP